MVNSSFKKKPLVSIVINCHNGEKYLNECIKSVLNQSYKNWEIIFFDNNSNDKSSLLLKKHKDKRIKYYFNPKKTLRLYKARNLAIKKCKGEFVSFLDIDDWWSKNKLTRQINFFLKNKEASVLYSNLYLYDEKTENKKIYVNKKLYSGKITQDLIDKFEMSILSTIMKRKLFEKIKFDNKYTMIGDFDFFVRLSFTQKIYAIQEPLVYYRLHDLNLSKKKRKLEIKEMEDWVKQKNKDKKYRLISFLKCFEHIQLLKLIDFTEKNKNLLALKIIFEKPFRILKFFKFLFFFLKIKIQ